MSAPADGTQTQSVSLPDRTSESRLALTVAYHPRPEHLGARVEVPGGASLELGRYGDAFGPDVLDESSVSRRHATVEVGEAGRGEVRDDGSHNGTFVNGERTARATLRPGDVLRLGRLVLAVDADTRPDAPAEALREWVGFSPAHHRLVRLAAKLDASKRDVLVWGEAGTGRRSLATALVDEGGLVVDLDTDEAARTGFDPRDEADPTTRVVGVSARAPASLADVGHLGPWLARVASWSLHVPPLRTRPADIAALIWEFVRRYAGPDARPRPMLVERLCMARWPGHAAQLEAVVERAVLEGDPDIDVFDGLEALLDAPMTFSPTSTLGQRGVKLVVARDGQWFHMPGEARVELATTPLLRRVLVTLTDVRVSAPGKTLDIDALFAAGWPDQRAGARARRNRVHVALTKLRKLGLADALQRIDSGYRIDPQLAVQIGESPVP